MRTPNERDPVDGRPSRALWFFLAGVLCLQAAWILAVPAFRGLDEIDHAYRAVSVVRGHVAAATEPVPDGRGQKVMVPESFVRAAEPACEQLKYVGRGNCYPVTAPNSEGDVGIASAASLYMPLYYGLVGWPSLWLTGEQALYAMRMTSMLLCNALLGLAAAMAWKNYRPWFATGLLVCLTPAVIYATTIVAPNGLSMVGGLLMWIAWTPADHARRRALGRQRLWLGALGAAVCSLTHNTGPIWVLLTILIMAALKRPWRWPASARRTAVAVIAAVLAAMGAALIWALTTGANSSGREPHAPDGPPSLGEVALRPMSWLFQSIFGAPRAGGFAEPYVYGLAFTVLLVFCLSGLIRADRNVRLACFFIACSLIAIPAALTALTYENIGFAWQGRYSIPLGVGITVLAAAVLSDKVRFTSAHLIIGPALGVVAMGAVLSARANLTDESARFLAPSPVAPTLCLLGCLAWMAWLHLGSRQQVIPSAAGRTHDDEVTSDHIELR